MSLLKFKKDGTWISVVSDYAARALVAAHNVAGDAHAGLFNSKVNTVENSLTTTNKNVVGAINELDSSDGTINARIDNIGRYLALWNGPAGLPTASPATLPYTYKAGDHYKISTTTGYAHTVVISPWAGSNYTATVYSSDSTPFTNATTYAEWLKNRGYSSQNPLVATGVIYGNPAKDYYTYYASADQSWKFYLEYIESGETYGVIENPSDLTITDTVSAATICYRPNGSAYTGIASTTVETSPDVAVGDIYFYDGTAWSLQINHGANAYTKTEVDALFATKTELSAKSSVSVSSTGTATDEIQYITVDGVEKKFKDAGVWGEIGGTLSSQTDLQSELTRLDGRCDNLQNLGRYLSLWNCGTGLPSTNPSTLPYTYKSGDYYRVGSLGLLYTHTISYSYAASPYYIIIQSNSGASMSHSDVINWLDSNGYCGPWGSLISYKYSGVSGDTIGIAHCTNMFTSNVIFFLSGGSATPYASYMADTVTLNSKYKPNGSSYIGVASSTVEMGDVAIGDVYFYDGISWSLQINHSSDTYTKTESDALFATKAITYTKSEVDAAVEAKSTVSVSASGSATDEVEYITVNGVEKKIKSGDDAIWGNITGTLSNQTDLQNALNIKIEATSATLSTAMPVDANTLEGHAASYFATAAAVNAKSTVSVSASGSATDEVQYITINGVEKKLAGGGGSTLYEHHIYSNFSHGSTSYQFSGTLITTTATPFTESTFSSYIYAHGNRYHSNSNFNGGFSGVTLLGVQGSSNGTTIAFRYMMSNVTADIPISSITFFEDTVVQLS